MLSLQARGFNLLNLERAQELLRDGLALQSVCPECSRCLLKNPVLH